MRKASAESLRGFYEVAFLRLSSQSDGALAIAKTCLQQVFSIERFRYIPQEKNSEWNFAIGHPHRLSMVNPQLADAIVIVARAWCGVP